MGADVSAERGRYTSQQKADFERRYREMYGENLSREELLERYRMEKLKAERKRRLDEANAAQEADRQRRSDGEYTSRSHRYHSRERDDGRYSKRQHDNFRIIREERERRERENHREHRSPRSRGHRDDGKRRKHRSRHRRYSSRSRNRSRSSSTSSKENRRSRKSSEAMKSSDRELDSKSKRGDERSSRHKDRDGRERSKKKDDSKRSSRSRSKHVREYLEFESSEDDMHDRKEESKTKSTKSKGNKEITSNTVRSKKRKNQAKAERYKSAPDLTLDREYGKGAWGRAHDYFDSYEQRPQSWVEEIATDRNSLMPAPVMERQIIYSLPQNAPLMDGMGYSLSHSQAFSSIPLQNVYGHQQRGRPRSVDLSAQEPHVKAKSTEQMQSAPTEVKIPAGAVPALGPNAGLTRAKKVSKQKKMDEQKTKSTQKHGGTSRPSKKSQPKYQAPPQYGQSATLPRSDAPTPKPRMRSVGDPKSPVSIQSVQVRSLSPKRSSHAKKNKGRITSFSAREDFESLLASDYATSYMMNDDLEIGKYATSYPGNYRPNQEIFVDDVIIRNHPPLDQGALPTDDSDSEGVTDEEHVLTLGYSSGFDLEIPEGFCFDSDVSTKKGTPKKKKSTKSHNKVITPTAVKPVYSMQGNNRSGKQQTLVLTSIEPIARSKDNKKSDKSPKNVGRRPDNKRTTSTDQSSSPVREYITAEKSTSAQGARRKQKQSSSPEIRDKNAPNRSTGRKSRHNSQPSQNQPDYNEQQSQIHPTSASIQQSAWDQDGNDRSATKHVQHPMKNGRSDRVIIPSKAGWSSEKITHDIGVGTNPWKPNLKSTAVQTPRKKKPPSQPPAQPIYFLKPISSQEVFIEDSSIVSHSETDMTRSQITSATSEQGRTATSYSRSSTMSPNTEYTEQSEVESVTPFQRNSTSRVGMKKYPSSLSSAASFDPEPVRVVQPAMKIGIAESIQADHYTSSGGQVFFITRSRPASVKALTDDVKSVDEQNEEKHQKNHNAAKQDNSQFDAHEVGKWVLDCYAQDQKLKSNAVQSGPTTNSQSASVNQLRLTKQSAVEYEASYSLPSAPEKSPTVDHGRVVALTKEALQSHNGNILRYSSEDSKSSTEVTSDNIGIAQQVPGQGVFQQELMITKNKIKRYPERERTPEPTWKSEKYQSKLNHWNASPSGNVVLAEVCSVNDTDDTDSTLSKKSSPPEPAPVPTPPLVPVPTAQPQIQLQITKNTRVIRPDNRRPRYNEEIIAPTTTINTTSLQRGDIKLRSVSRSSTDRDETQRLPNVPVAIHSQMNRNVSESSEYSESSSHNIGKPVLTNPDRSKPEEPVHSNGHSQAFLAKKQPPGTRELVKASNASTQQDIRPTLANNQSNSFDGYQLKKAPSRPFVQQPTQAPEWSKKPSITARNHNRQPYLEKIARASETSMRQQAYQSSKPKAGSLDSQFSASSQADERKLQPKGTPAEQLSSKNHVSNTGIKAGESNRPTLSAPFPTQRKLYIDASKQEVTSDSETETTLSSDSSEVISPKRTLREALMTRGPYSMKADEESPRSNNTNNNTPSPMQNAPLNRNPTPGPRRSLSVASQNSMLQDGEDWRIVGQNNKTTTTLNKIVAQQNPSVPKPQAREKLPSVEVNHDATKSTTLIDVASTTKPSIERSPQHSNVLPRYQKMNSLQKPSAQITNYTTSSSNAKSHPTSQLSQQEPNVPQPTIKSQKASTSSSDELDNPFNAMDEEEISSIVEKIPGRTTITTRSGSESDIMEKFDKPRMTKKTETLEERTARILGIHRRTSADDSSSEKYVDSRKVVNSTTSSVEPKRDLSTYMNDLLTGATTVSPATKQKYLSSDNGKTHGASPLVTNSVSSNGRASAPSSGKSGVEAKTSQLQNPPEESDQESESSNDGVGANLARASPVSPHGKMLLSYGNNIYAETPGFHKQQRSYDSTDESDENYAADEREQGYGGLANNSVQERSTMSPPRSQGENTTDSQSSEGDSSGGFKEVMQSIGLDPSAAWTMSV